MKAACCAVLALGLGLSVATTAWGATPAGHSEEQAEPAGIHPRYLLMNPGGSAVTDEDFHGRFQLISFGYTSCPDVCPTTLLEMKDILKALDEKAAYLQPIFVTVDPERDTPQVLREYTAAFDARILGLTGSPELIRRAADTFRVRYAKVSLPGTAKGQYTLDHSAGMILLGPDGSFVLKFAYGTPAPEAAQRIRELIEQRVSRPSDGSSRSRPPGSTR